MLSVRHGTSLKLKEESKWCHNSEKLMENDLITIQSCCSEFLQLPLLGPVVQSIVSLTRRVISLTVLADSIYNILIFFAEKM